MPVIRRSLAAAVLALAALAPPAAAQGDPVARFDRRVARIQPGAGAAFLQGEVPSAQAALAWNALDSVVLGRLRHGDDLRAVASLLGTLRGFEPPTPGDGEQVGGTTFYSTLPREAPGYFVAAPDSPATVVLGVYNLGMAPGRVSAYARHAGRWVRTGAYQARNPVRAFALPAGGGRWGLATVETFTGGDRQECYLKLWTLSAAGLRRDTAYAQRMVDCQVTPASDAVRIAYDAFPQALGASVLGVRLGYVRTLRAQGGRLRAMDEAANPWVHVAERFYALRAAGRPAEARRLLAGAGLAAELRAAPGAESDEGDRDAGTGSVTVRYASGDASTWRRIRSARGADGVWRIVAVEPASDPNAGQ